MIDSTKITILAVFFAIMVVVSFFNCYLTAKVVIKVATEEKLLDASNKYLLNISFDNEQKLDFVFYALIMSFYCRSLHNGSYDENEFKVIKECEKRFDEDYNSFLSLYKEVSTLNNIIPAQDIAGVRKEVIEEVKEFFDKANASIIIAKDEFKKIELKGDEVIDK